MKYLLGVLLAVVACAAPDPVAPKVPEKPSLYAADGWRPEQVPVLQSAVIVEVGSGDYVNWNLVRLTWQDNAVGEAGTVAGYSADNTWLFVTMNAQAPYGDESGADTGVRTVDFYAPKTANQVQLMAWWQPDPADPDHQSPTTGYGNKVGITDPNNVLAATTVKRKGKPPR